MLSIENVISRISKTHFFNIYKLLLLYSMNNLFFLRFSPKIFQDFLKIKTLLIIDSFDKIAKLCKRSFWMGDNKYILISFTLENSFHLKSVTGTIQNFNTIAMKKFDRSVHLLLQGRNLWIFIDFYICCGRIGFSSSISSKSNLFYLWMYYDITTANVLLFPLRILPRTEKFASMSLSTFDKAASSK